VAVLQRKFVCCSLWLVVVVGGVVGGGGADETLISGENGSSRYAFLFLSDNPMSHNTLSKYRCCRAGY
jgi:hypothetical protein